MTQNFFNSPVLNLIVKLNRLFYYDVKSVFQTACPLLGTPFCAEQWMWRWVIKQSEISQHLNRAIRDITGQEGVLKSAVLKF